MDFVQQHLTGRVIAMYYHNGWAKASTEITQGSYRSKHIAVSFHFQRGLVRLQYVAIHRLVSVEQHADILTNP